MAEAEPRGAALTAGRVSRGAVPGIRAVTAGGEGVGRLRARGMGAGAQPEKWEGIG